VAGRGGGRGRRDLARELLDVHAQACDAGVADPVKLAAPQKNTPHVRGFLTRQERFELPTFGSAVAQEGVRLAL